MKLLSINRIHKEVEYIINMNPMGSLIGVVGNQYCGFEYFTDLLTNTIDQYAGNQSFEIDSNDLIDFEKFDNLLLEIAKIEFDQDEEKQIETHNISDSVIHFINNCSKIHLKTVVFIIKGFEKLDIEQQYRSASQFRNVREKLKNSELTLGLHIILTGGYSSYSLEKYCIKFGTSSVFDNLFYVANSTFKEVKSLFNSSGESDGKVNISHEYCNGVLSLVKILKSHLDNEIEIEGAINKIILQNEFIDSFEKYFSQLNEKQISLIIKLLNGFEFRTRFNEQIEELYLSGCISLENEREFFRINIRNWVYEVFLRRYINKNVYKNYKEILAPVYTNNVNAYKIIMRVENKIRNIIIFELSKYEYIDHPLELLNVLGKIKEVTIKQQKSTKTIYENCIYKRNQFTNDFGIKSPNTLSSFLGITDLKDILSSDESINENNENRLSKIFGIYFPEKNVLIQLLEDIRQKRNLIAHNNLIDELVVNDLLRIERALFNQIILDDE